MEIFTFPLGPLAANAYLVADGHEALVIDPGGEAPALLTLCQERKWSLRYVLLTHTHFDHMLGAPFLIRQTGAQLIVPQDDAAGLTDGFRNLLSYWELGSWDAPAADRTVKEGDTIAVSELTLQVWQTPGHTPGSCCYLESAQGVLFSGDTLFDGSYGRTDLPGGDEAAMRRSLARLQEHLPRPLTVYPGHGAAFLRGDRA